MRWRHVLDGPLEMIRNGSTTQLVGIELLPVLDQKRLPSLVAPMGKNLPAMQETWVRKIPWRRAWQPLQCSCLENPMVRGASLAGYSP